MCFLFTLWRMNKINQSIDMWQAHYKKLLNNVDSSKSKESVERKLHSIKDTTIVFRPVDIFNALKVLRLEKHVE